MLRGPSFAHFSHSGRRYRCPASAVCPRRANSSSTVTNSTPCSDKQSYDHAPLDRLSCGEAMADLSRCDGVLQELAGEGTYWVRPPYGFITEEELAAWSTPMLYWSVDTCDWECRDVQKVFAAICQARDGDVILLHDCYGTSVEAALQAIDWLPIWCPSARMRCTSSG